MLFVMVFKETTIASDRPHFEKKVVKVDLLLAYEVQGRK